MACPNSQKLAKYQANLFTHELQARMQRHIDTCAHCRQELQALAKTTQLLEQLSAPAVPDDLWQGVAARLQTTPRRAPLQWVWKAAFGMAAAASLAVGIFSTRWQVPALPVATGSSAAYVSNHELLSSQDPLTDRAGVGVILAAQRSNQ